MSKFEGFCLFWFVVNFLERTCILSCWILVCLEVNDIIFGTIDFVYIKEFFGIQMFIRMYHIFCSLVTRMCQIFWVSSETFFFYYPSFSKILGLLFHLRALNNGLIDLVEGLSLYVFILRLKWFSFMVHYIITLKMCPIFHHLKF